MGGGDVRASHQRIDNLIAMVDHNGLQIDGACDEVMCLGEVGAKFRAFGWTVIKVDGHDVAALLDAFDRAQAVSGSRWFLCAPRSKAGACRSWRTTPTGTAKLLTQNKPPVPSMN